MFMASVAIYKQYIYPHDTSKSIEQETLQVYEKHHHSLSENIKRIKCLEHITASEC